MAYKTLEISDARILSQYAKGLPVIANNQQLQITMKGKDLLGMGVKEIDQFPVHAEKNYMYQPPFITSLFHYKFLVRAWHRCGQEGLSEYLRGVAAEIEKKKKDITDPRHWTDDQILHFLKHIRKISLTREWLRHEWALMKFKFGMGKQYSQEDVKQYTEWKKRVWKLLIKRTWLAVIKNNIQKLKHKRN